MLLESTWTDQHGNNALFCMPDFRVYFLWQRISNPRSILGIWALDKRSAEESSETPEFCIDSLFRGNVSRFINHSCEPNLFCQSVMSNHSANEKAIKVSRVVLFAKRDIPANEVFSFLSLHTYIYVYVYVYINDGTHYLIGDENYKTAQNF